ncbi:Hypothetical protein R9X50_00758400 [Acrodontium crateriforme]|uniref:Glycosyltransferase 2 n=1 Tax=Acrodontium crateriforme TaxID=150365 RepID=A0AAQ3MD11_9PEZI|nr:Hypothetical protein R9X50_00758400 [Acrodontium crateriforme]
MPGHSRVYSKDEELGKRDDDFRPKQRSGASSILQPWHWRKRRLFAIFSAAVVLYLFIKNIPKDLGPVDQRLNPAYKPHLYRPAETEPVQIPQSKAPSPPKRPVNGEPTDAPPRPNGVVGNHYYDGTIKYFRLASSLRSIAHTMGSRVVNRNVLFAASSLKSAANLMPMACEMAKWDRNYVHLGLFGRDDLSLNEILSINGVDRKKCGVYFHDARPDYSEYSSENRAETSVLSAMKFVQDYMHPQAIIMDDSILEDPFFTRAMRVKANEYGRALIEVPASRYEDFMWMIRLDSGSLSNWFRPKIDILIQSAQGTSGNMYALVKSLLSADYAGLRIPRLTIDLPMDVAQPLQRFLGHINWPPVRDPSPIKSQTLTLHHRISAARMNPEQASVRFLETFFPVDTEDSHVLVLSPQAQLDPLYLHYLHYAILEYKYSSYGSPQSENLLGISLDVPTEFLNGTSDFLPPPISEMNAKKYLDFNEFELSSPSPFIYQAPSSSANLIFGDKWATFHNFLTNRLTASHTGKAEKPVKLVSEAQPAWLEYLLELMRARGWTMLYPATPFVKLHNEGAHIPEEFAASRKPASNDDATTSDTSTLNDEDFLSAGEPPQIPLHVEHEIKAGRKLHLVLPFQGELPELENLPHMAYDGHIVDTTAFDSPDTTYVNSFRHKIGLCDEKDASRNRVIRALKTDDLFCLPGMDLVFDSVSESASSAKEKAQSIANMPPKHRNNRDGDD